MCGIYGYLNLLECPAERHLLRDMAAVTVHRGPDDEGYLQDGPFVMGMRRLSIIDVAHGHQPLSNETGDVSVICNGEIYNFRELRKDLISRGHKFKTSSDSEVVVHLYEEHGDACVSFLDGMFGLAIWDARRRTLVLARDRLGIKPLYVARSNERIAFASEMKALLALNKSTPSLNRMAVAEYLTLGYVPNSLCIVDGIEKLEPGHVLVANSGGTRTYRYWRPSTSIRPHRRPSDWLAEVRETLERSVAAQMVSDVPLGAFLSGGIDSSAVVAMMSRHSDAPIRTYSIGFDGGPADAFYNELPYARQVSKLFSTDHKEIIVRPDVARLLPELLWHMDEPVADSAFITTYLVSKFAAEDVTVILSGVGGDELFGGYRRYLGAYYGRYLDALPHWLRQNVLVPLAERLPGDRHSRFMNLLRYAKAVVLAHDLPPDERYRRYVGVFSDTALTELLVEGNYSNVEAMRCAFDKVETTDPINRLMEVDLVTQLPDDLLMLTDRMSMATSIECRVPLLDQALVNLALTMPSELKVRGRNLKYILKQALADVLPKEILYRSKRGFGAPMGFWLKSSLAPLVETLLSRDTLEARGLFRFASIERLIADHGAGRDDYTDHLQALTNLEIWSRIYLDGRAPDDVADELVEFGTGE